MIERNVKYEQVIEENQRLRQTVNDDHDLKGELKAEIGRLKEALGKCQDELNTQKRETSRLNDEHKAVLACISRWH